MEVKLIDHTAWPQEVCSAAYRTCHDQRSAHELLREEDYYASDIMEKRIRAAKKSGHLSVLEHASFTFSIKGVSRALTHQLVRHRIASYSQQSQRYVNMETADYVTPPTIMDGGPIVPFMDAMEFAWNAYNMLVGAGVPEEDARFVLPNACTTNIVVTMNARELLHFFELRTSSAAQWEIRQLARRMLALCLDVAPIIFEGVIEAEPDDR